MLTCPLDVIMYFKIGKGCKMQSDAFNIIWDLPKIADGETTNFETGQGNSKPKAEQTVSQGSQRSAKKAQEEGN